MTQPDPLDPAFLVGKTLQQTYLVEELVGEGGMAFVYRATHQILDTEVALKIMRREYANKEEYRKRFLQEARTQYRIHHPHIVRVLDFLQDRGLVGCVQEWCNGGELIPTQLKREEGYPTQEIQAFFLPLLDALEQVHRQGFVHRDLKPQNILIHHQDGQTRWKINDFGLLKDPDAEVQTQTGMIMGTFHYISPEQFEESKHVDKRTDIYSMGVVLYQLLLDRVPFTAKMPRLAIQIMDQAVPFPPSFPKEIKGVLEKALAKNPEQRFENCSQLKKAILEAIATQQTSVTSEDAVRQEVEPVMASPQPKTSVTREPLPTEQLLSQPNNVPKTKATWSPFRVMGWLFLALFLASGAWLYDATKDTISRKGSSKNLFFQPEAKVSKELSQNVARASGFVNSVLNSMKGNWGVTRYNMRQSCRSKVQCFWYAHWLHHTLDVFIQTCRHGDKTACHWLKVTRQRKYKPIRYSKRAIPIYQKACGMKEVRACYALGKLYKDELHSETQAPLWFEKACQLKHAKSCLTMAYFHNKQNHYAKALQYLELACRYNSSKGCIQWGLTLKNKSLVQHKKQIRVAFQKACSLQDQRGCVRLKKLSAQ